MRLKSIIKYKTIKVDISVIAIRETLMALNDYFCSTPDEIKDKIQEITNLIDDKYMPLPEHEKEIDILEDIYKLTYKYVEYLE